MVVRCSYVLTAQLSATKKSLSSKDSGFFVLPPDRARRLEHKAVAAKPRPFRLLLRGRPGEGPGKACAARLIPRVLRLCVPARRLAQRESRPMCRPEKTLRRNSFRRSVFSDCAMTPALPAASLGGKSRPPVSVP